MIANYGYQDGSGEFFIGCASCVRSCRDLRGIEAIGFVWIVLTPVKPPIGGVR